MKNKWMLRSSLVFLFFFGCTLVFAQTKTIVTDIFTVEYSEDLEQPTWMVYMVQCPNGTASRSGTQWHSNQDIHTSDLDDYRNNVWDRGHLAPAADFSCDKETIKKTFTYLNCALQHEGLNRGPWKELERFERDLAKFYEVKVEIEIGFDSIPKRVEGGAAIPSYFIKTIYFSDKVISFRFPNIDVAGEDWFNFIVANIE